jgi:membrane fusion protein
MDLKNSMLDQVAGGRGDQSSFAEAEVRKTRPNESGNSALFRKESQEALESPKFGKPVARLPVSWQVITVALLIFIGAVVALLSASSFERRETAKGILRPQSGEARVFPVDRGVITSIRVTEGDLVKAGQTLATVVSDRTDTSGKIPQQEMLSALLQQDLNLERRLQAINQGMKLGQAAVDARRRSVMASLVAAQASLRSAEAQLKLAREEYNRAKPVADRGFLSKSDMVRREQAVVIGEENVAQALGRVSSLRADLDGVDVEGMNQPLTSLEKSAAIQDALSENIQRRAQYHLTGGFTLRAPVSGRVSGLQATIGATADPMHALLSVVPEGAPVVAVVYVASRGAGMLKKGQLVRLRFDAFPFQRFGMGKGRIRSVSSTVQTPDKVEDAVRLDEPTYRVVVELEQQSISAFGKNYRLQSGMALTADIVLERRSMGAWLLSPLLSLKGRL